MGLFNKNTDVHHVTVAGVNPHDVASEMKKEDSPFYDPVSGASVYQHIVVDDKLVGGIVDVWTPEHMTAEQEKYLKEHPNVIDVRHVYP